MPSYGLDLHGNFNFSSGHESIEELTLFTSELLDIAKNIALIKGDFAEQVGGLYLMYSLYYRQNTR